MELKSLKIQAKMFFNLLHAAKGLDNKSKLASYFVSNILNRGRQKAGELLYVDFKDMKLCFRQFSSELTPYHEIFLSQEYENVEGFEAQPGWIIMDVGANIGTFAIHKSKKIGPQGKVYAFEPNPDAFERMKINLDLNEVGNVNVENSAVYKETGTVTFGVRERTTVSGSIVNGTKSLASEEIRSLTVRSITLDDFIQRNGISHIHLMKIDVEGGELEVIAGGTNTLKITDRIVLEYHSPFLKDEATKMINAVGGFTLVRSTHNLLYFVRVR